MYWRDCREELPCENRRLLVVIEGQVYLGRTTSNMFYFGSMVPDNEMIFSYRQAEQTQEKKEDGIEFRDNYKGKWVSKMPFKDPSHWCYIDMPEEDDE